MENDKMAEVWSALLRWSKNAHPKVPASVSKIMYLEKYTKGGCI